MTKVLAARIKEVLPSIIHHNQTGSEAYHLEAFNPDYSEPIKFNFLIWSRGSREDMSGTRGLHADPVHMTAGAMADTI